MFRLEPEASAALPCRSAPDVFFGTDRDLVHYAKTLCAQCPIKARCLAGAIDRAEAWGVWGGEYFHDGVIRKGPHRGRKY